MREGCVFQNIEPPYRGAAPGSALALIGFIGLCLLVFGSNAGFMRGGALAWYLSLERPPLVPPDWVFAPVWAVLYVLLGVAAWLVWCRSDRLRPLRLWGWQLLLNGLWTPAFFGLHSPPLALVVMLALLGLLALVARAFRAVDRRAALLLVPYGLWLAVATYLNLGFWWLNTA